MTGDDRYDNAIMLIELGLWTDFERISDDVKISVIFTPKRDQPESVYAIMGKNAENLTGEEVEVSGHFNVLKAETTLNVHFVPPKTPMSITTSNPTPTQEISKPEPIKLSGRDSSVTSIFPLERGASIFRLKNDVPSNFKVLLVSYTKVGSWGTYHSSIDAVLVDEIGPFDGVKTVEISDPGDNILDVETRGNWSVIIEKP